MTDAPTLTTERLILRMPNVADFAGYGPVMTSERAQYMGGPFSVESAWKEFATEVGSWALHGAGGWSITDRDTGQWLGSVQLNIRPDFPERELGWLLAPEAEGQGFAFEAAETVLAWTFEKLRWKTLVSYMDADNFRAVALAERLGGIEDFDAPRPGPEDLVFRYMEEEDEDA